MTDEIEQLLKNLRLRKTGAILDDELAKAEKTSCSHQALIAPLLRAQ